MTPTIPKWLLKQEGLTARQWKQRKRRELNVAIKAMERVRIGCSHAPTAEGKYIGAVVDVLEAFQKAWSQKEWGK